MQAGTRWRRWTTLAAALLLLDVSLTFRNIWPTPAVRWTGDLSIELAVGIVLLALAARWLGPPSRAVIGALSGVWLVFVFSHYADVTAPALYGRGVNLYWDLPHMSGVIGLLAGAAAAWRLVVVMAAIALILWVLYRLFRWGVARLVSAMASVEERRALVVVAAGVCVLFIGQHLSNRSARESWFSTPVTQAYARQMKLVLHARSGIDSKMLAPSPPMTSDFGLVKGADVLLLFIESYGAISYDRPDFAARLAPSRARLDAAIHDTGRAVVSAFVESPTFGGLSWLAHISLLSGLEVRDPDVNATLMAQKRPTMVTAFSRHGYRTVALMPGMWQAWPEGVFYGFDEIYGGQQLDYHGPSFGWWDIPDQFSIARMDALEINRTSRAPLFVFFPTISTHIPFSPLPPYQPDWQRVLSSQPYDEADVERAFEMEPDWMDLAPSYLSALSYADDSLAGYLRERAGGDFVLVVLGDHQPAAAVTGEGAPWDVPVHIITSRRAVLDRLIAHGFSEGLTPKRPRVGRMHELTPLLLDAFSDHDATSTASATTSSSLRTGHWPAAGSSSF